VPRSKLFSFAPIASLAFLPAARWSVFFESREILLWRLLPAILVTVLFAALALRLKSVTRGGALAGSLVSVTIYLCTGPAGFVVLGSVFLLTVTATRIGTARKRKFGIAESAGGRRAPQILANLAIASLCGAFAFASGRPWLLISMTAALAEAASDTVSSECGKAWSDRVFLVTNFEPVPAGTDGGISIPGSLAGIASAAVIAWLAYALRLVPPHGAILAGGAAVIATFFDSFLGATLQRRGRLTNSSVNFASTLAAALIAGAMTFGAVTTW
jgi:uncharacterized protein (TIGR00297 family)